MTKKHVNLPFKPYSKVRLVHDNGAFIEVPASKLFGESWTIDTNHFSDNAQISIVLAASVPVKSLVINAPPRKRRKTARRKK